VPFFRAATAAPSAACFIAYGADPNTDLPTAACWADYWLPAPTL
jgi:hypothetical protein